MRKKDHVLRINVAREPTTLDPRKIFDPSHQACASMLFEGLTKLQADLTVTLAQADALEVSPDRLIYTFHIGPHNWSDGTPVTAFDFKKTFLQLLSPDFPAPHTHLLYDIKNAQQAKKGLLPIHEVGITALDAKTLQITLRHPNPSFLQILANVALTPICQAQDKKTPNWAANGGSQFICNGPFILASWNHHVELIVKRNPHYQGKITTNLTAIHVTMINNEASALHMYANGYLDIVGTPFSQIPFPYLKDLKEQSALIIQPVAASLFCSFNTASFPFHNIHLRKAFSLAIHRRGLIEHITLLDDEPGLGAIPSILKPGSKKTWIQDGDVTLAKQELDIALSELHISPKDLEQITLYYWPFELNYRIAQTIQQQWLKAFNIKINIEVIDFKTLLSKVHNSSYQIAIFAWSAEYADPLALLERFRLPNDAKNYCLWQSQKFNALLDDSAQEQDPDKRLAILEDAEAILMDEMPIAPLFHWNFPLLVQPHVKGLSMNPLGVIHFEDIFLQ